MSERKKLIEVALPLEAINRESAREKSIRHGHPSTLHLWWARRPLAACRAVLFASLVDDPSSHPELYSEEDQERERQRLFRLIEELVRWESSNDERVLAAARAEIERSTGGAAPMVLDPFCGGGSIPLEAQRLGLEAQASDLNPVAVLITKALTEIPARFAGRPPCNPDRDLRMPSGDDWSGARGLAEDVRWYGNWMRDEAWRRIGHLYPKVKLPDGGEATVIAWLWARTVTCPNPACGAEMPLVSSFRLATKRGKERWVRPIVDPRARRVDFDVSATDPGIDPPKLGRGARFRCLVCGQAADEEHVKAQGVAGRMGQKLMTVVAEGDRSRLYVSPSTEEEKAARVAAPRDAPSEPLPHDPRNIWCVQYGLDTHADLFSPRQLVALTTFADLVTEARERVLADAGDVGYADAVVTYLGLCAGKLAAFHNSLARWRPGEGKSAPAFGRQAVPMVWDYAEVNPFAGAGGDWTGIVDGAASALGRVPAAPDAKVSQADASRTEFRGGRQVCTDPPYYDNIGYADLSDFFYVWLRRTLHTVHPEIFATLLTPKTEELVATPYRFGGDRQAAERFFEEGLKESFARLRVGQSPHYPLALYYAFKQAESRDGVITSTGWETMLTGLLETGFAVTGTWPLRTEMLTRQIAMNTGALASSILLVCRPRPESAPLATRRELVAALRADLPEALARLQQANIAPVDLAQASIGPGMAVFSRYSKVVEADGSAMTVRTALGLINQSLDEILAEQEGDFDADTRFAITWFEQRGMEAGGYGEADVLARAKNTSVAGMVEAGVLAARAGKVRLLARRDMPDDWDPVTDRRPTAWEAAQHLTRRLEAHGEDAAADLLRRLGSDYGEQAKELAYRLFSICERKGWAQEAIGYNALVVAWPEIARRVAGTPEAQGQGALEV